MIEPCQTADCRNDGVVVVREDALNGKRLCVDCLKGEGRERGWWD